LNEDCSPNVLQAGRKQGIIPPPLTNPVKSSCQTASNEYVGLYAELIDDPDQELIRAGSAPFSSSEIASDRQTWRRFCVSQVGSTGMQEFQQVAEVKRLIGL
jgi:hypothetical protein